jgi:hypothetical protein
VNHDDEIRDRLRALGQEPIDPQTRAAHMRRMGDGAVVGEPRRRGFVWAGIAAAAVVGFLAGSTGLALADALPDPAQNVAHDVLRVVQVDVPQGKEGKRGPCVAEAAKIKDKDAKKAAKDACPKGGPDESGDDESDDDQPGQSGGAAGDHGPPAGDACHGRPPWAGPMSKEQRAAAKASASRENCPKDDEGDEDEQDDAPDADEQELDNSTTTTSTSATAATPSTTATPSTSTTLSTTTSTSTTSPAEPTGSDEQSSGG